MIRYALKCSDGHVTESWFQSAEAYDKLARAGQLSCAVCGDVRVEKALMAPSVPAKRRREPDEAQAVLAPTGGDASANSAAADRTPMLSAPSHPMEAALRAFRAKVEANAENVGRAFARVARNIHHGEEEARPIYGEATRDEALELIEDGVPVAPLPWTSRRDD